MDAMTRTKDGAHACCAAKKPAPARAAGAMSLSSVIANALRLRRAPL